MLNGGTPSACSETPCSVEHRQGLKDGGASTLELALLTPVLLLVMLFVVQYAMVYHARHVALASAQAAARVARTDLTGDWQGAAESKAVSYAQSIGPRLLTEVKPTTGDNGDERWVIVSGYAVEVVPFFRFHVEQRSGGPIECFRPDIGSGTNCEVQPS